MRTAAIRATTAVSAVVALMGCSSSLGPGPLERPQDHAWGHVVEPGVPFGDGVETTSNPTTETAVLKSVELVGEGIELVGAKAVLPGRKWASVMATDWPPEAETDFRGDTVVPLDGVRVPPNDEEPQGILLVVGMKVAEPGYYVREGFYLNYEVAGEDFRQFFPAVLAICAGDRGPRRPNGECKPPKNWEALNDQM